MKALAFGILFTASFVLGASWPFVVRAAEAAMGR